MIFLLLQLFFTAEFTEHAEKNIQ